MVYMLLVFKNNFGAQFLWNPYGTCMSTDEAISGTWNENPLSESGVSGNSLIISAALLKLHGRDGK